VIQRCTNPKNKAWVSYGGRGVVVCDRWRVFGQFLEDMGVRPPGLTLERLDNDKGYEPGNCQWATRSDQMRNTRATKLESHEPEQIRWLRSLGYPSRDLAAFYGVAVNTIHRVLRGDLWG
jgi:hypothetical protein